MSNPQEKNCIDIIRPYATAVTAEGMPQVQFLGGVGSVALLDAVTVIRGDTAEIYARSDLYLSNYRDDGNLRDIETLVFSSNPDHAEKVEQCANGIIGDDLIVETFEFRDAERNRQMLAKPLGAKALMTFVSDRYIPVGNAWSPDDEIQPVRALFPFSTPMDPEALRTWSLEIGDDVVLPVPSPGAVVINYLTRSMSGLRGKDKEKVERIASVIFEKSPETVEWIVDGPGKSQFEMARVFHTLREPNDNPTTLTVGGKLDIVPMTQDEVREHETFMLKDHDTKTIDRALALANFKSRTLHRAESQTAIVTFFQRHIEPKIGKILHNK